ncbi:hypothetical protein [Kribbella sp. NPDC023855]|uniref:hypothetical protein n=1 Tax=Kribbella sp. NPDC023855 TaxID=3154698 RepID=UPI003411236F
MTATIAAPACPNPICRSPYICPGGCEARGTVVDRLRDLADELEKTTPASYVAASGLTPIPGNDLKVGDRLWVNPTDFMVVDRIGISHGPSLPAPMLMAYGERQYGSWEPGKTCRAQEPFFGHDWVVVER